VVAARPARPGSPDGSVRVDPLRQGRQFRGHSGRVGEEGDQHVSGTDASVGVGVGRADRRVGEIPPVRTVHDAEPQPRFEPELASLCHHEATDAFTRARTSTR
jgi:hypothetical protein